MKKKTTTSITEYRGLTIIDLITNGRDKQVGNVCSRQDGHRLVSWVAYENLNWFRSIAPLEGSSIGNQLTPGMTWTKNHRELVAGEKDACANASTSLRWEHNSVTCNKFDGITKVGMGTQIIISNMHPRWRC